MAVGAAVVLHAGAVWLLLPHGAKREGVETPPTIEIEMIDQPQQAKGAPAATAPPPVQAAPEEAAKVAPPAPDAPAASPEAAAGPAPDLSPPQPQATPPPAPPQQAAPQPPREAPPGPLVADSKVNLGDAEDDQEALTVRGENVVPPRPDALFHNKPPSYPIDAVRRHAEGVVGLRVHVTENGTPGWVDVVRSSGDASLDRSAREAVALWRFQPARDHGAAVAFDYSIDFEFNMARR